MIKNFPLKFFTLLICLISGTLISSAQINADGQEHNVLYNGTFQDFVIPNNPQITKIRFSVSGADGGAAILNMGQTFPFIGFETAFSYKSGGGNGAVVNGTFLVGTGAGKIPLGSTVRFIIGQKGETGSDNISLVTGAGTGSEYGGGGGGSAILYRPPGATVWTLLGVAGGGGGAYQGVIGGIAAGLGDDGGAGEESENGADGGGAGDYGQGGISGNGGGSNVASPSFYGLQPSGAGGGGRFMKGEGMLTYVDVFSLNISEEYQFGEGGSGGSGGSELGGYGGNRESQPEVLFDFRDGGFGYGGGGAAAGTGGGGGGYAGGGAGGVINGGGGGGSYLNGIRETGNVSGGGSDTEPDDGIATYQVTLNQPPVAICKNITIYLDANGQASISSSDINDGSSDPDNDQLSFSLSKSNFSCADVGNIDVTLTVSDIYDATDFCIAVVTVVDNTNPTVITQNINAYLDATGNVTITPNQVNNGSYDNCAIDKYELDIFSFDCDNLGPHTVTLTVTDVNGNSASNTAIVTVVDNLAPVITSVTPGKEYLWPPDHKMHEVDITIVSTDNCPGNGITCKVIGISSNEPVNENGDGNTSPDWEIMNDNLVSLRAERSGKGNGRIYTITVECEDGAGNKSQGTTTVSVAHDIKKPGTGQPFIVGSTVAFHGEFGDKAGNTHTAKWMIDGSSAKGIVTEPTASKIGSVTGSYKFGAAGVYKLQMNVTDQKGITSYANTNGDLEAIVVIYDPNGGHTYGGGYFNSPAGALKSNTAATGKASYGFAMNYFKNSTNPKGETQFEFKIGDFEFNALNFDYLVISNSMAQFKGTGKISGVQSGIGFTMTVTDGQLDGSGVDKIRMKIYNKNNGDVIYDNLPGASDAALPTQAVGINSNVVISGKKTGLKSSNANQNIENESSIEKVVNDIEFVAYPNPSTNNFVINVKGNATNEKLIMQVVDMYGRVIETRNVNANSMIRFGDRYKPGTYFVSIMNGNKQKGIKLIKLPD